MNVLKVTGEFGNHTRLALNKGQQGKNGTDVVGVLDWRGDRKSGEEH